MPKLNNIFVSESCLRFCAIDFQLSFLAFVIASKKIRNCQWNSCKLVAIWHSEWNLGFSLYSILSCVLKCSEAEIYITTRNRWTWIVGKGGLWVTSFIYKYKTSTTYPLYETTWRFILLHKWHSWVQSAFTHNPGTIKGIHLIKC